MSNLHKIPLKLKVGILFAFILVSSVASFFVNQKGFDSLTRSYERLNSVNHAVVSRLSNVNNILLQLRRNEKDFLLRDDQKYVKKHSDEFKGIEEQIAALKKIDPANKGQYDEILKDAQGYQEGFKKIVALKNTEGNSKEGIRGEMRSIAHTLEQTIKKNNLPTELYVTLLNFRRREKDFLLRRDPKYYGKLETDIKAFNQIMENSPKAKAFTEQLSNSVSQYKGQFKLLVENTASVEATLQDFRTNIRDVMSVSNELTSSSKANLKEVVAQVKAETETISLITLAVGALQGAIVFLTAWILFGMIKKLIESSETLTQIVNSFQQITGKVQSTATSLSSLTTQQASAIQETASSITEINSMVERTTQNTLSSKELSETNAREANVGRETINNVITSMESISESTGMMTDSIEKNSKELQGVVDIINTINEKTKIINDIVFQTKLLSFNASVEAARAGEHGKGFSVVAEEISNLADVSGGSAKEITEILEESVNKVQSLVDNNRTELNQILGINRERVNQGRVAATECDEVLSKMLVNINNITTQVTDISQASIEQSNGVKEISQAINELSAANQEIASMSSKTDMLSQTIYGESQSISRVVIDVQKIVFGKALEQEETIHPANKQTAQSPDSPQEDEWESLDQAS